MSTENWKDWKPEKLAASPRVAECIRKAREAALAEINPSPQQIERGLALHHESIVCDLMGGYHKEFWSSMSGMFTRAMEDRIQRQLSGAADQKERSKLAYELLQSEIGGRADLRGYHKDGQGAARLYEVLRGADGIRQDYEALRTAQGVDVGILSNDWAAIPPERLMNMLGVSILVCDAVDFMEKIVNLDKVEKLKQEGKHGVLWLCHGRPVVDERRDAFENLDLLYEWGVRWSLLTHGRGNEYCGAQRSDPKMGLTDLGRVLVQRMNKLGIIVDTSHCSAQSAIDIASISDKPVIASHTCCRALDHGLGIWRNFDDHVIKAIVDSGGLIGICSTPTLTGGYTIEAFMRHVDHAVKLVGVDRVAWSSDYGTMMSFAPRDWVEAFKPDNLIPCSEAPPHAGPFLFRALKYKEAWDFFAEPNALSKQACPYFLTVALVARGYSDEDVRKIIGGNFIRVANSILGKPLHAGPLADGYYSS